MCVILRSEATKNPKVGGVQRVALLPPYFVRHPPPRQGEGKMLSFVKDDRHPPLQLRFVILQERYQRFHAFLGHGVVDGSPQAAYALVAL